MKMVGTAQERLCPPYELEAMERNDALKKAAQLQPAADHVRLSKIERAAAAEVSRRAALEKLPA
jgi:hypothetical protein